MGGYSKSKNVRGAESGNWRGGGRGSTEEVIHEWVVKKFQINKKKGFKLVGMHRF